MDVVTRIPELAKQFRVRLVFSEVYSLLYVLTLITSCISQETRLSALRPVNEFVSRSLKTQPESLVAIPHPSRAHPQPGTHYSSITKGSLGLPT